MENAVRRHVGLELARLMAPGETLATELAGYYEFDSNATMYDYPGLTSPTARKAIQSLPPDRRGIEDMIDALQPDWLALTAATSGPVCSSSIRTQAARYDLVETVQSPEELRSNSTTRAGRASSSWATGRTLLRGRS